MELIQHQHTRHVTMFAGKGGVGKTTCAGATALHHSRLGGDTLIISTDPTPSLAHIFEVDPATKPAQVTGNLQLSELGQAEVRQMWDRKFGPEMYEVFSSFVDVQYDDFCYFVTSILPGLHDEFMVDYIRELCEGGVYQHIVWDTAPLGQTLGLLETPAMLREHLRPAPRIYSKLKLGSQTRRPVLDILRGWEELSARDMEFLRQAVEFNIVTIPEALAVQQLDGILEEMARFGFHPSRLVVNNVIKEIGGSDFLAARAEQQQGYLETIHRSYGSLMRIVELPWFPHEIKGLERLRQIEAHLFADEGDRQLARL